jgi:methylated-DNA-[protein]-cysteine S-methyltransferase
VQFGYSYQTQLGCLTICAAVDSIVALNFGAIPPGIVKAETALIRETYRQLTQYLNGMRRDFDLPLNPRGTAFQHNVWMILQTIPYGQTRTYRQIAAEVGNPQAARAVGMANNRNPLPILIPCHRVIGADGSLTGYGGGLAIKRALLELERNALHFYSIV